jgi:hypothetical protein
MEKKLASLKVFLKMANDLDSTQPVIALCCRVYYLDKYIGLKKQGNLHMTPEENAELSQLLNVVGEAKKIYSMSKEETKDVLEDFCGKNFARIDIEDHNAPKLTKEHASQFNTTAHFIELLSIYDGMTPKWEEKGTFGINIIVKYCKLKASNILKCIKQGIDPPRGNPNNPDPPPNAEPKPSVALAPENPPSQPTAPHFIEPPAPHFLPPPSTLQPPEPVPQSHLVYPSPQPSNAGGYQSASAIVGKRKVNPNNPYNEMGKIVRQHPKYFDIIDKAQKLLESAMNDLGSKGLARAVKNLEDAYKLLDQLEN